MQSQYDCTWFSTEYVDNVVHTKRGSMAGMTLADIVYASASSRILNTFVTSLRVDGLLSRFGPNSEFEFLPVAFHDDVVVPSVVPSCAILVDYTTAVAASAVTSFSMFSLKLNFKVGKSEALALFNGKGTKKSRLLLQNVR